MRRIALVCLIALCVGAMSWGDQPAEVTFKKASKNLDDALALMAQVEPNREGPLHDKARGATVIIHSPNPEAIIVSPVDDDELDGGQPITLYVEINNWHVHPEDATNTGTQFANGHQQHNTGHTHVWIYDLETGERVRFTGATGLTEVGDTGIFASAPFTLPPGRYKAFVQCQNDDHTPPVQATPQSLPAIDTAVFTVTEPPME